jgi:ABC-type Zn uptake system ZnuABC Zn-binding protein ZnuA
MHTRIRTLVAALVVLGATDGAALAADKIRVVTTTMDLKALTEMVGGPLVEVDALARGTQNPHDLEVRPSLMVKVRRADVLVVNGLDLDGWVDQVVRGANNPRVLPGAIGWIDASRGVPVLEVPTTRVDRSMGDVHPHGNPHYTLDPGMAPIITQTILEGLARAAPQHRAAFEQNRQAFLARLEPAMAQWAKTLEPFRGARTVAYHSDWIYFLTRFQLVQIGAVEDRPGIPPTPGHLTQLIRRMRDDNVKVVIVEPWSDQKLAARVAEEGGAKAVVLAAGVGSVKGTDTFFDTWSYNVNRLAQALRP